MEENVKKLVPNGGYPMHTFEDVREIYYGYIFKEADRELIKNKGLSLITPVLITNPDIVKSIDVETDMDVVAGENVVLTYNF